MGGETKNSKAFSDIAKEGEEEKDKENVEYKIDKEYTQKQVNLTHFIYRISQIASCL